MQVEEIVFRGKNQRKTGEFSDLNLSKSKFILIKYKSGCDVSSEFASFVETVRIKCA